MGMPSFDEGKLFDTGKQTFTCSFKTRVKKTTVNSFVSTVKDTIADAADSFVSAVKMAFAPRALAFVRA